MMEKFHDRIKKMMESNKNETKDTIEAFEKNINNISNNLTKRNEANVPFIRQPSHIPVKESVPYTHRTIQPPEPTKDSTQKPSHDHMNRANFGLNCQKCGSKFRIRNSLIHHLKYVHNIIPFSCVHCPSEFTNESNLKWHKNSVHSADENWQQFSNRTNYDNQWYQVQRRHGHQQADRFLQKLQQQDTIFRDTLKLSNRYAVLDNDSGTGKWE